MHTINDVHEQFAEYFKIPALKPYAYLLSRKLSEGHICLNLDNLKGQEDLLPERYKKLFAGNKVSAIPLVGQKSKEVQPFILYQNKFYLQRYFNYETLILERLQQFLFPEKEVLDKRYVLLQDHRDFMKRLLKTGGNINTDKEGNDPYDWQLAAVITGFLNNFTIITGGPGTGKTTTVAKLLVILYAVYPEMKVALAAPTGKAATRMAESLRNTRLEMDKEITAKFRSLFPSTIHRLLKPMSDSLYFKHNAAYPLDYDVVIIDECSMIDVALFAKLLMAIGPATRLILLGDKDQLASVEAGSLFGDICQFQTNLFSAERLDLINQFITPPSPQIPPVYQSGEKQHPLFQHIVELKYSHRFSGQKGIGKFSKAIISNDITAIREFLRPGADEEIIFDPSYSQELFQNFVAGYETFIREKDIRTALQGLNSIRVLCAIREGEQGLYAINRKIERYLSDRKLIRSQDEFYENRPIILTRNYYEHGLFNGDTGIIRSDAHGVLMAWFEDSEGGLKAVLPGYLTQAETVYAMTIHKSQGSEFGSVLVVLPATTGAPILTRELLYTAVSRAKHRVLLQGSAEVVLWTAGRHVERVSGIAERLEEVIKF